jgi:hypothetical protein
MPEEPKDPPQWQHDQKLNFNNMKELMVVLKDKLEETIAAKKKELSSLLAARDSLTRK